ncbi:unnamed protein product [Malus baccata var. baccata]
MVETLAKKDEELTIAESKLLKENIVRDAKALGIIQGAVSDQIFPRIAIQEMANAAWNVLKQEFVGDKQRLVQKLLISLPRSYDSIASVIENTKDLDTVDVQDVVAILKGYEQRIDRHDEAHTEKAFVSLNITPKQNKYNGNQGFKPQKNWKSKWKKGNNKPNPCIHCDKLHFGECWFKDKPRCHNCHKLGHIAKDCRGKKVNQHANFVNEVNDTPTMFYVCNNATVKKCEDTWYVESGCSNHMTGREELLVDIDRTMTTKVEMGTGKLIKVIGKCNLAVETKMGKSYIKEVMLVSGLQENQLSVGQMMEHGYFLVFGGITAAIYDDESMSNLIAKVPMKGNRSFPMKLQSGTQMALKANVNKSEVFDIFKKFKATVELQNDYQLKKLRSDRG